MTVGRITGEKGYDIVPSVLSKLINSGYEVRWYCIGDGECRNEVEGLINQYNLEGKLILLGTKLNPYPYFKECDIYVQTSRHEGYCIILAEARAFNKPIVTTDFVGALEQITNNIDGLIVKFNENDLYEAIKRLLDDKELVKILTDNLNHKKDDTVSDINILF